MACLRGAKLLNKLLASRTQYSVQDEKALAKMIGLGYAVLLVILGHGASIADSQIALGWCLGCEALDTVCDAADAVRSGRDELYGANTIVGKCVRACRSSRENGSSYKPSALFWTFGTLRRK